MGCGAAEATGLGFVCFVVINPWVLSANRVDLGFFLFHKFSNFTPPPPHATDAASLRRRSGHHWYDAIRPPEPERLWRDGWGGALVLIYHAVLTFCFFPFTSFFGQFITRRAMMHLPLLCSYAPLFQQVYSVPPGFSRQQSLLYTPAKRNQSTKNNTWSLVLAGHPDCRHPSTQSTCNFPKWKLCEF